MAHLFGTLIHSMASLGCTNIYFYPAKPYIKQPNSSLSENAKYSTKIFCAGIFLPCRTHSAYIILYHGVIMRFIYTALSLLPAPLFALGFIYSVLYSHHSWEMPLMWFIMALAHTTPWLLWLQQRNFTRN
jgi:hypothetical protein